MRFERVHREDDLRELLDGDVIVFKHSERCGISQDRRAALADADIDALIRTVEVREQRGLSDVIEDVTGVSHESPQLIVVRDGDVARHASHMSIDPDEVRGYV